MSPVSPPRIPNLADKLSRPESPWRVHPHACTAHHRGCWPTILCHPPFSTTVFRQPLQRPIRCPRLGERLFSISTFAIEVERSNIILVRVVLGHANHLDRVLHDHHSCRRCECYPFTPRELVWA